MSLEIVKVQVDLMRPDGLALISPKDDVKRQTRQKLDERTKRAMNGHRTAFFKASWIGSRWRPVRRYQDQPW